MRQRGGSRKQKQWWQKGLVLGQMSEGARRKPEVKRGELSWRGCEGRAGSREGGMESVGRKEEEGNPMAAEHKRDKAVVLRNKGV